MNKKPDSSSTAKDSRLAVEELGHPRFVVPRGWLVTLAALIVVPWLAVVALYSWRTAGEPLAAPAAAASASSQSGAAGPWGELMLSPIVISPPLEYVGNDWGRRPQGGTQWLFPGMPPEALEPMLQLVGLGPEQMSRVRAAARPEPGIKGVVVRPDDELVRGLDPQVRSRLYTQLAKIPSNHDHVSSFRFQGDLATWLGGSPISAQTRALLEPLIYEDGGVLHFADVEYVRSRIADPEELRRLAKVLLRQRTVLVRLTVDDPGKVAQLAEYWGRGGRSTDLRPLLESVAGGGESRRIDIVHLLPAFARNRLYRYPRLAAGDFDRPLLANCVWTALNFFSQEPDDRFMDLDVAMNVLRQEYYVVQSHFQLGDVVAFVGEDGNLFHAGVYLADDLIFSKNGTSPVSPWVVQTVDELKRFYRLRSPNPRLIYHRRNDF